MTALKGTNFKESSAIFLFLLRFFIARRESHLLRRCLFVILRLHKVDFGGNQSLLRSRLLQWLEL